MSNAGSYISKKQVKRNFTTIGLFLIIYVLLVLILPFVLHYYFVLTNSPILIDDYLYYGIYFIIILFGTVLPFFLMRKFAKIPFKKMNRNVSASFLDLFVQTIVFFTVTTALTFVANIIVSYIGLEEKLISSIGFSFDEANLDNILYVFMLIVVTPIVEEYAFRGVLLNALGKYGKKFALYASALIFALCHNNFAEILPAFAMGIALNKTSLKYKSIKPTILIHILFNLFIYVLCIMPAKIAMYMGYGLVAICLLALFLFFSGRYQRVIIQKSSSSKITNKVFYTRPTIIITMILTIISTLLLTYIK